MNALCLRVIQLLRENEIDGFDAGVVRDAAGCGVFCQSCKIALGLDDLTTLEIMREQCEMTMHIVVELGIAA